MRFAAALAIARVVVDFDDGTNSLHCPSIFTPGIMLLLLLLLLPPSEEGICVFFLTGGMQRTNDPLSENTHVS